jgi:Zn-dependent protease with chaperone function
MMWLRTALRLLEDRNKAISACHVLTVHEMGHIYYQHGKNHENFIRTSKIVHIVVFTLLTILAAALLALTIAPLFALAALAVPILGYFSYQFVDLLKVRHQEFQADRFAATHVPNGYEGVQHATRCFELAISDLKKSDALTSLEKFGLTMITLGGGEPVSNCFTHGSHRTRVARFRDAANFSLLAAV